MKIGFQCPAWGIDQGRLKIQSPYSRARATWMGGLVQQDFIRHAGAQRIKPKYVRPKIMDTEAAQEYIEILLDYQYDLLQARVQWGVNHAEFLFIQIARVLNVHDELRSWFLRKVEDTLFGRVELDSSTTIRPPGYIPDDFIWFFAHLTRWPEFSVLAERIKGTLADPWKTNPLRLTSRTLMDALQDDWEDRDFYESFSGTGSWV